MNPLWSSPTIYIFFCPLYFIILSLCKCVYACVFWTWLKCWSVGIHKFKVTIFFFVIHKYPLSSHLPSSINFIFHWWHSNYIILFTSIGWYSSIKKNFFFSIYLFVLIWKYRFFFFIEGVIISHLFSCSKYPRFGLCKFLLAGFCVLIILSALNFSDTVSALVSAIFYGVMFSFSGEW